ncbi:hypothetical protein M5K25_020214 [Dendrobium thyrsiflorum]|uniref:Uncharacterized protein n=1 Tax=Dendrobium thyrsiflorum TaxID=117978 RepID=A0ABD0U9G7_DENTH
MPLLSCRRFTKASEQEDNLLIVLFRLSRNVKLNVSERRTQRHQIQLNPSPNESKSRTRSAVGRFKPQFELPNGFQTGRSYNRIERLDEKNPTSPRSLNYDISKSKNYPSNGGPGARREEGNKRGREGRDSSSTTARVPPGLQVTPDFPPASKRRRSFPWPPSDAGLPPGLQATPEFRPASKGRRTSPRPPSDAGVSPGLQVMPVFPPASMRRRSSTRPPSDA